MTNDGNEPAAPATPLSVLATIVVIAMLIGGNFTALKFALDHAGPLLIAALRTVIGGTFLIALALLRGERLPHDRSLLTRIFVVSFSITTVSSGLLVFGVDKVPAGFASLISSTMPLFTACLSLVLLGVRVSPIGAVGLVIGFGGTAVLASPALDGDAKLVGAVALLLSAIAWAFGTVFMKWKDFSDVTPIMLVGVQLWMSAVVLLPFALGRRGDRRYRLVARPVRSPAVRRDPGQRGDVRPDGDGGAEGDADPGVGDGLPDPALRGLLRVAHPRRGARPHRVDRGSARRGRRLHRGHSRQHRRRRPPRTTRRSRERCVAVG